jgi:hypothetical protein
MREPPPGRSRPGQQVDQRRECPREARLVAFEVRAGRASPAAAAAASAGARAAVVARGPGPLSSVDAAALAA